MWKSIRENPRAVMYAVLMHLVLLAVLVFSLDWTPKASRPAGQKVPIEAQLVDPRALEVVKEKKLAEQRKLDEAKQQAVVEEKRKVEQEAKRRAEAEKKQQAEQEAKRKAEAEKKQQVEQEARRKAAAVEKQKQEQETKRKAEAKRKAAAEKKRQAEQEAKRKAEAEKQAEAERKRKAEQDARRKAEAERKRKAEETRRREAEQALQQQLAAEQVQRTAGVVAEYTAYIQQKIERNWLRPPGSPAGLSCTVQVSLIPGGDVASVKIVRSSGDPVFDRSVETAVFRAAPLPLPPDSALFNQFRHLNLIFKPS